ncbi:hypothetical protein EBU94_03950 [bacterium]|nr:hypothetical protein [bacterium]
MDNLTEQEQLEIQNEVLEILNTEYVEPTVAVNILINAVQASFEHDCYTDTDRQLIAKSLQSLKRQIDLGEDFIVKVK